MLIANKPFPFSRDGVTLEHAVEGEPVDLPAALVPGMVAEGFVTKATGGAPQNKDGLRLNGPTVAEFVAAGYLASNYPPEGYASLSTPEEIAAAVASQERKEPEFGREAIEAMTDKAEIAELLEAHGVDVDKRKSVDTLRGELLAVMFVCEA